MKTFKTLAIAAFLTLAATGCAVDHDTEIELGEDSTEVGVRSSFDLFTGSNGQYYFHLNSGNGAIMLTSEGYTNRTGALNGILSVLDNGGIESRYVTKRGTDGQYYISLRATNGQTIAVSEGYANSSNAKRAIGSMINGVSNYLAYWNDKSGERFEIFQGADKRFYFRLFAGNGEQVLRSQSYSTEASALNGAFAVSEYGTATAAYDVREAANGGYYFNVRAPNNQIIGTSEVYASKWNAERARDSIIALLPSVELL